MIIWRKIMRRLTNGHDHDNDDGGGRCQYGAQWGSSSDQSWAVYLSLVESRLWSSSTLALLSLIFLERILKDHDLETPRLSIQSHPRWCCLRCLTSLTILPVSLMSRICQGSMSPSRPPWTRSLSSAIWSRWSAITGDQTDFGVAQQAQLPVPHGGGQQSAQHCPHHHHIPRKKVSMALLDRHRNHINLHTILISVWRYPKSERNRIRNFFPIPNFSNTESTTF